MFDFDNVKASVQEKACRTHRVRQVLNDLRNVNINDIVSNDIDLGEDEILAVMTTKISMQAVNKSLTYWWQYIPIQLTLPLAKISVMSSASTVVQWQFSFIENKNHILWMCI